MSFQPFHPLKKDVPKLTRRKSKKVREDLIPSSFDSEFGNFKSSRKNFTLFELQDATDDFSHGTKVKGILKQLADVEEVDRIVQEYEQAFRRYEATWWLRKVVGVIAAKDLPTKPSKEEFNLLTFLGLFV
ncbi:kinesin-like protein KIN-14I isoform X5 [Arachis ipaensis]|uniref:kinesin-like protein KIN-14I isoform X5 n=1 Tax=Arachis ipaensis TaxID=130454 RepID=UPI000A2AFE19|nr:kinesin-like protein KIN-14I isoform X5 [Arachis ipaensis]XP_029147412.1 kinesin-like protein KIN-14I isoform X5 [Arachis hypogaea]